MNSTYLALRSIALVRLWGFTMLAVVFFLCIILAVKIKQLEARMDAGDVTVHGGQQAVDTQITSLRDEVFRLETLRMFENRRQSGRYFEWKYETAQQTAKAQKILTDEGYQVELQPDGAISVAGRQW